MSLQIANAIYVMAVETRKVANNLMSTNHLRRGPTLQILTNRKKNLHIQLYSMRYHYFRNGR